MFKFASAAALVAAASADVPAFNNPEFIEAVNAKATTWKAALPARFANATTDDVKGLCGTVMKGSPGYFELPDVSEVHPERVAISNGDIPDEFSSSEEWSDCAPTLEIRDQSACGSCWAFSSTESLNVRMCIASDGKFTDLLSPADTVACCGFLECMSMGCNGGQPSAAWSWFTRTGVVTGGDYSDIGSGSSCEPYPFEACAHHVDPTPEYPACPDDDYKTPKCTSDCSEDSYEVAYADDKKLASTSYGLRSVEDMQTDIMTYGPISAAFSVYEDFVSYESGVYQHEDGSYLGGHAILITGWGEEDGTPYWTVHNSWNPTWGDNGTFKILRGSNECGIEGQAHAGQI